MTQTLLFYDLETSGFNPRDARIMQFAGQRTDMKLQPIGDPHNYFIKMTPDVLPQPDAILVTGITPQQTIANGLSEAEFLRIFYEHIALPGTIFVGFNNVRFDDEFLRFLNYRNFYDPYEWHWSDGRGRWDLLDVVRMTRALRPDGITWPVDSKGVASNRLELLASVNKLTHEAAHDALSDVQATIALAQLLQQKQPKLFQFLLDYRDKKRVAELIASYQPFVYTSGKYPSAFEKTTVAVQITPHPKKTGALVFDLRHDPTPYLELKAEQLAELWQHRCQEYPCPHDRLPVKTLQFNRCPAVAPLSVLDSASQKRLELPLNKIQQHADRLQSSLKGFTSRLLQAVELLDIQQQTRFLEDDLDIDAQLYDSFLEQADRPAMHQVRSASVDQLASLEVSFHDERLNQLFPLYKARNYPKTLSAEERITWEKFCERKLLSGKQSSRAADYFKRLGELAEQPGLSKKQHYILEELQLYGQSILPLDI